MVFISFFCVPALLKTSSFVMWSAMIFSSFFCKTTFLLPVIYAPPTFNSNFGLSLLLPTMQLIDNPFFLLPSSTLSNSSCSFSWDSETNTVSSAYRKLLTLCPPITKPLFSFNSHKSFHYKGWRGPGKTNILVTLLFWSL